MTAVTRARAYFPRFIAPDRGDAPFFVVGWPDRDGIPHVAGRRVEADGTVSVETLPIRAVTLPASDEREELEISMQALEALESGTFALAGWPSFDQRTFVHVELTDEAGQLKDVAYSSSLEAVSELPGVVGSNFAPCLGYGSIRVADITSPGHVWEDLCSRGPVLPHWTLTATEILFADYDPARHLPLDVVR